MAQHIIHSDYLSVKMSDIYDLDNNYLKHYGTLGMKWGVWNDETRARYSGTRQSSQQLADKIFENAKKKEPKITKDVINAAKLSGSEMYGLNHRLKTQDSIKRKIDTDSEEKEISISDAANDIKDAVRYTTIQNTKNFVTSYFKTKRELEKLGYEEVRCRNYFEKYLNGTAKHKSVQSVFRDPKGYLFEIQFQTPESQKAKDEKVPIYEERRKPGLSEDRKVELEELMVNLMDPVPIPDDVLKIKSH